MPPLLPPQVPGGTQSFKGLDVITQAMLELGVIDPNEVASGPEANTGLVKLNRLLDAWNADGRYVYNVGFTQYPITPNLQPATIGPINATYTVAQRPVKIINANIILTNVNPNSRSPLRIRDDDWWNNQRIPSLTGTLPTDLYYSADWPNGAIYLWPIPTVAYKLELETWGLLQQVTLAGIFSMPPGYLDAVVYSLAISLAPSFQTTPSPILMGLAMKAIARIWGPNAPAPRIGTRDAGMPKSGGRSTFNYRTGRSR